MEVPHHFVDFKLGPMSLVIGFRSYFPDRKKKTLVTLSLGPPCHSIVNKNVFCLSLDLKLSVELFLKCLRSVSMKVRLKVK